MEVTAPAGRPPGLTGVLIVNLGTPDSPAVPDVRKYLRQFLLDGRVIDIPELPRQLLVNGIIAPFRAPKSAKGYAQVWDPTTGSPLRYYSERLRDDLQQALGDAFAVKLAMRYQSPSLATALRELQKLPLTRLVILPLFPQYASATVGSVNQAVMDILRSWQTIPHIQFINRFFDEPSFIEAVAKVARPHLAEGDFERVLFSYHGLPERQILKGDTQGVCKLGSCCDAYTGSNQWCYRAQCFANSRMLAQALVLGDGEYETTFQSRFGKDPWTQPYLDDTIVKLRKEGVSRVAILSPAFVADCIETVLELGVEYREKFEHAGGKVWKLIPCVNDDPAWRAAAAGLIRKAC